MQLTLKNTLFQGTTMGDQLLSAPFVIQVPIAEIEEYVGVRTAVLPDCGAAAGVLLAQPFWCHKNLPLRHLA